ncbi:Ribosomal protein L9/RNase H1 isoform 2 [Hibiscus syriacus]|uniref:Large ribosomal subunit protein bL9c n=1 Tax=Hibiscus syriacus TaxID=106335 RepID=A0A6A2YZM1_HIBSY|nr:Ribosomal protein L9/RNase H1 isoform 2 [Hibiscus syriacus]
MLYACQGIRHRKLDVILMKSIEKLGKAGETVKVAPGYFRNHLMPKLLAVHNIDKFAYLIREQRKIYQPKEEEVQIVTKKNVEDQSKEYEKAAYRLLYNRLMLRRSINVEKFHARSTKDDPIQLHSPVTKDELVAELCIKIEPENLHLPTPLETFGMFDVQLRMPRSIPLPEGRFNWTLKVKIRGQ